MTTLTRVADGGRSTKRPSRFGSSAYLSGPAERMASRWWGPLLRDGVRPMFLTGDVTACVVVAAVQGASALVAAVFVASLLALLTSAGLYRSRLRLSLLDDLPALVTRWLLAFGVLSLVTHFVLPGPGGWRLAGVGLPALLLTRLVSYAAVRYLRGRRVVCHTTVVVGADDTGVRLVKHLQADPRCGLLPLGFLDDQGLDPTALPVPLLGQPSDLLDLLERHRPRVLILGRCGLSEEELVRLVRACHRNRCEVFVIPRLHELQHAAGEVELVWDIPLVRLYRAAGRSPAWRLKRPFDVAMASLALVVLAPLMLLCAFGVFVEGGRHVIFRQERVGCDGRRFALLKFRSLRPVDQTESETRWTVAQDHRIGPVGRLLRITSLDELPQLVNVLRGDMSLVGPRPERPHFVEEFGGLYAGYTARHRVPSGLTGWAQIHGLRGDTSILDRARFDNLYIENWSLWLDVKILLLTAISLFKEPGA